MSEKNVPSTQWTKSPIQKLNYNAYGAVAGLGGGISCSIYGGGTTVLATHPPHAPDNVQESYANIRFQPPSTRHVAPPPPPPTPNTVLMPLGVASSNVPALSGFVPPSYSASVPANITSAATSVLTPNPFAVQNNTGSGSSSNVAFGLEQFQHLNVQQQFEFTKMMTAMNTAATLGTVAGAGATTTNVMPSTSVSLHQPVSGRGSIELASTSGAITNTVAENVLNVISTNSANMHVLNRTGVGVKLPDEDKMRRIQQVVESGIGDQAKQQILQILDHISTLKPMEKLLLYLRLPGEAPETDPLRHPQNPLGTRSEINHTINWVRSHLEHDPQVSIPKQDVYNEYLIFCERLAIKPLSTADFGKVMKQVFPEIRPRRLGTRGHSRYCYAAMRKTTKLSPPQLPQLGSLLSKSADSGSSINPCSGSKTTDTNDDADGSSWDIIKMWAENILKIKVENMKSLAEHIQASSHTIASGRIVAAPAPITQKKVSQREPKEKRPTGDLGPLKKRRKKKRKGSSSSESSCNQSLQNRVENSSTITSPVIVAPCVPSSIKVTTEEEKKSMIEVKQEVMDSPNYPQIQSIASPHLQTASITTSTFRDYTDKLQGYNSQQIHPALQPHNVQQLLPMNLATEPRTVLARAPPSVGAFPNIPSSSSAAKNLTPKIMDLSSPSSSTSTFGTVCTTSDQVPIKEEVVDDYNPTNIFCKKVLKAQQTKGFWINSPLSATSVTALASPVSVIATTSTAAAATAAADIGSPQAPNYLMGPPAQVSTSTSPSLSTVVAVESNAAAQPKVSSRNMMRAKKLRYYQMREAMANSASPSSDQPASGENATDIDKDADLPENLGLPRERVISICNMDKHELDDYFLPGEEENSQDQEAELLQYFQTGDAEENPHSSDAAKKSHPTALHLPPTSDERHDCAATAAATFRLRSGGQTQLNKVSPTVPVQRAVANEGVTTANAVGRIKLKDAAYVAAGARQTPIPTPAVGSASASLALMSQKHQQQQNKRKINLNALALSNIKGSSTRKNCIFLPISPNINNATVSSTTTTRLSATNGGSVLFASPGLTRLRPRPAVLSKQQSLDSDINSNSDPMICARRRRKSTYSLTQSATLINTSASAPPSPSALQNQQQKVFGVQPQQLNHQWHLTAEPSAYNNLTNHTASLLAEQNSLDLDLFNAASIAGANNSFEHDTLLDAAAATTDCPPLAPLTETQRSQSVPLSQLQRIHSPSFSRHFQAALSTCTSVAQTPVPSEFADFSLFCENSEFEGGSSSSKKNTIKSKAAGVLASDATVILEEVDVSDILSSPDFVNKFSSVARSLNTTTTTTCSSAGSSSGYSSGTCTVLGGAAVSNSIVSRSVPSTPLPHQQQYLFGTGGYGGDFYNRQRAHDEIQLSPTSTSAAGPSSALASKYLGSQLLPRAAYDISKSMPTTPITTPCFRYSPVEFSRDFLINGNTLDSITSLHTMDVLDGDNFMNGGMDTLHVEALVDDGGSDGGVSSDAYAAVACADSAMVGSDLLDNL